MRIVTPAEVAGQTQNKYLGVLVAAKFARFVNDFPRDRSVDWEEKLTTRAFDELVRGGLKYRLVRRRPTYWRVPRWGWPTICSPRCCSRAPIDRCWRPPR